MTTYNTGNPIGSTDARDLSDNAQSFDEAINSTANTYTDRRGVQRKTLKWMETAATGIPAVQAAIDSESAKTAAEAARDAAIVNSTMYPTEAAGRAAVADGAYFKVIGSGNIACKEYVRTNSTTSVLVAEYPSINFVSSESRKSYESYAKKSVGKNLFNSADIDIVSGGYLGSTGVVVSNSGFSISGYIPISPGQSITCSRNSGGAFNVLYDAGFNVVASYQSNSTLVGTSNTKYARFSIDRIDLSAVQIEIGTVSTAFETYTDFSQAIQHANNLHADAVASLQKKLDKVFGKNLFNPLDPNILVGKYISSTGNIVSTAFAINVSGFIPINPGESLKANFSVGNVYAALYSSTGAYISGSAVNSNLIMYSSGAAYARFSYYTSGSNFQVEVGSVSTDFEAYTEYKPLAQLAQRIPDREPVAVLPSKLFFVKDFESSLYFDNVIFAQIGSPAKLSINVGFEYSRQSKISMPNAGVGFSLTARVIDNFKLGALKEIAYDVKDAGTNSGKTLNVLYVGDSFTDIGTYAKRCNALLRSNGVTVNEIGTTGNTTFKAEGLSGGNIGNTFLNSSAGVARIVQVTGVTVVPETGYPGATYKDSNNAQWSVRGGKVENGAGKLVVTTFGAVTGDFANFPSSGVLTKVSGVGDSTISYSSPVSAYFNPFINHTTGVLDINHYLTFWGFNTPNVVVFQFTWNDTGLWATDSALNAVVGNFKAAADHVHSALPSAKVVFSIEPFGSLNANLDVNGKKYSALRLVELMLTVFEGDSYSSWLKIAPSYAFVDLVYGYSSTTVAPSSKYPAVTEQSGGDGVHPRAEGMEQIGECVYQVISNII